MQRECFICHSCSEKVELISGEPPCIALNGWLMISRWKGVESVDYYSFCSFTCLQRWVNTQVPQIPQAFLNFLGEDDDRSTDEWLSKQ